MKALRAALRRAGFDAAGVAALLGARDPRLSAAEEEVLWSYRARGAEPLAVLVRFFLLGQPVTAAALRAALGDQAMREAGALHRRDGRQVRPRVALSLHHDLVIASDVGRPGRAFVQGPTTATFLLERLLIEGSGRILDLGTGTGYLALRLARQGAVIGSDVSPRALRFARLNARLNDVDATFVQADGLAVPGRFQRVVGNLPFVLSPERRFTFRDGPADFLARAIRGLRARLAPGGTAQYLAQWSLDDDEEVTFARLAVAAGCHALVLRLASEPADVHAVRWSAAPGQPPDLKRVAAWCAHQKAERICTGLITLRRHPGARHALSLEDGDLSMDGDEVLARLEALT